MHGQAGTMVMSSRSLLCSPRDAKDSGLDRISARQLYDGVHERMALRWVSGMRGESRALEPGAAQARRPSLIGRSEEHTSELQSLMRISYAVFCLKKKKKPLTIKTHHIQEQHRAN